MSSRRKKIKQEPVDLSAHGSFPSSSALPFPSSQKKKPRIRSRKKKKKASVAGAAAQMKSKGTSFVSKTKRSQASKQVLSKINVQHAQDVSDLQMATHNFQVKFQLRKPSATATVVVDDFTQKSLKSLEITKYKKHGFWSPYNLHINASKLRDAQAVLRTYLVRCEEGKYNFNESRFSGKKHKVKLCWMETEKDFQILAAILKEQFANAGVSSVEHFFAEIQNLKSLTPDMIKILSGEFPPWAQKLEKPFPCISLDSEADRPVPAGTSNSLPSVIAEYPLSQWCHMKLEQNIADCQVICTVTKQNGPEIQRKKLVKWDSPFTRTDPGYFGQEAILFALQIIQENPQEMPIVIFTPVQETLDALEPKLFDFYEDITDDEPMLIDRIVLAVRRLRNSGQIVRLRFYECDGWKLPWDAIHINHELGMISSFGVKELAASYERDYERIKGKFALKTSLIIS